MTNPFHRHNRFTLSGPSLFARLILCQFAFALVASAAPTAFVLVGVTFSDGATLSGSFDFDPVTNLYSNINLAKTGGGSPATTFTTASYLVVPANPYVVQLLPTGVDQTGNQTLILGFLPGLPATSVLGGSAFGLCTNSTCTQPVAALGVVTAGKVVPQPVCPDEYASWWFWYVEPPCSVQTTS